MSTGADNKTMPVTKDYEAGHERIFGTERKAGRGVWVMRCEVCDGVTLPKGTRYDCPKCGAKDARGSIDLSEAPPLQAEEAKNAPIMVDRFYEGARATDGTDIGSRKRHRQYMKDHNLTTVDDFKNTWADQAKQREAVKEGRMPSKTRREAIERALYNNSHKR